MSFAVARAAPRCGADAEVPLTEVAYRERFSRAARLPAALWAKAVRWRWVRVQSSVASSSCMMPTVDFKHPMSSEFDLDRLR